MLETVIEKNYFSVFEVVLSKRGRKWKWSVCTNEDNVIMRGCEGTRAAAKYRANSALFLLLASAPYRMGRPTGFPKTQLNRPAN
jgi:hypothetical protein